MRIAIANDGFSDLGGVQVYLDSVLGALEARGHDLAIAYCHDSGGAGFGGASSRLSRFELGGRDARARFDAVKTWKPDLWYSHNMQDAQIDAGLAAIAPVVKFMHGYVGTCIGGLKMHAFPGKVACDRVFGLTCLGLYVPRRCGRMDLHTLTTGWQEARAARALFPSYAAIVVASDHMRQEYLRHACRPERVHVNPLFPTMHARPVGTAPDEPRVAFLGRMTMLKGGDLLIRAVNHAIARLGRPIHLTMMGDGPQRLEWEALARKLGVPCTFTGWLGEARWARLAGASIVAVPSVWPEPFGLVGLEAGALGVPAIAHDVGGIREWLHDGENGVSVRSPATSASFGDALAAVLGDRDRLARLGRGARQVAEAMTLDAHVDRLEGIFNQVAGQRAAGPQSCPSSTAAGVGQVFRPAE